MIIIFQNLVDIVSISHLFIIQCDSTVHRVLSDTMPSDELSKRYLASNLQISIALMSAHRQAS